MHESALTAWSNFYVIAGSSAGALTGLTFVVITLVASEPSRKTSTGISTFTTPTVVHFCVALFISAVLSAPWHSLAPAGIIIGLTGLYGVAYSGLIIFRIRHRLRGTYSPHVEDWLSYAIVPLLAYVTIVGAAVELFAASSTSLFVLAGATMLLILLGIYNAWDIVTYIAIVQPEEDLGADAAAAGAQPPATSAAPAPRVSKPTEDTPAS